MNSAWMAVIPKTDSIGIFGTETSDGLQTSVKLFGVYLR